MSQRFWATLAIYIVPALKRSSVSFTGEKTNERFYYCFLQAALFQIHGLFVCLDDFWYNLGHIVHHFGTSSAEAKTPKTEEDGTIWHIQKLTNLNWLRRKRGLFGWLAEIECGDANPTLVQTLCPVGHRVHIACLQQRWTIWDAGSLWKYARLCFRFTNTLLFPTRVAMDFTVAILSMRWCWHELDVDCWFLAMLPPWSRSWDNGNWSLWSVLLRLLVAFDDLVFQDVPMYFRNASKL